MPHSLPPIDLNDDLGPEDRIGRDRRALEPVLQSLKRADYYAYGTIDEHNQWSIAVDDELGRVDVRIGQDGFEVVLWASSPGLYADEDNVWRRQSRARLARMSIPNIARGQLEAHQSAMWDEVDEGVAVTERYELPFNQADEVGRFVHEHLPRLDDLLTTVERHLN